MNILVVEDDTAIANLVSMNLKMEGYNCVIADDGQAGADQLEKGSFDLILLDIMLPKINGYELLEYIRPSGTPVIFLTAKGNVSDRIKGLRMGADDYIVKPFQIGELTARVEALQAYHSFWAVRLAGKHIAANLLVNAVTGEVWAAVLICLCGTDRSLESRG